MSGTEGVARRGNLVTLRDPGTKGEMEDRLSGEVGESPRSFLGINSVIMIDLLKQVHEPSPGSQET